MAHYSHFPLVSFLLLFSILIANPQVAKTREIPTTAKGEVPTTSKVGVATAKNMDRKQPQWFMDPHDGSFLIPGIGRFMAPFPDGQPTFPTYGGGGALGGYVPGGYDTFVPDSGFDVPIPGIGAVNAP